MALCLPKTLGEDFSEDSEFEEFNLDGLFDDDSNETTQNPLKSVFVEEELDDLLNSIKAEPLSDEDDYLSSDDEYQKKPEKKAEIDSTLSAKRKEIIEIKDEPTGSGLNRQFREKIDLAKLNKLMLLVSSSSSETESIDDQERYKETKKRNKSSDEDVDVETFDPNTAKPFKTVPKKEVHVCFSPKKCVTCIVARELEIYNSLYGESSDEEPFGESKEYKRFKRERYKPKRRVSKKKEIKSEDDEEEYLPPKPCKPNAKRGRPSKRKAVPQPYSDSEEDKDDEVTRTMSEYLPPKSCKPNAKRGRPSKKKAVPQPYSDSEEDKDDEVTRTMSGRLVRKRKPFELRTEEKVSEKKRISVSREYRLADMVADLQDNSGRAPRKKRIKTQRRSGKRERSAYDWHCDDDSEEANRHLHNTLERARRVELQRSFRGLADLVVPDADKPSKVSILNGAVSTICELQKEKRCLDVELRDQKDLRLDLTERLQKLKTIRNRKRRD